MKSIRSTLVAAAVTAALCGSAVAAMTKAEITAEENRIAAEFNGARARCDSLAGNAKDVCMAEAKGHERVARAELEARHRNTAKARYDAKMARADASYDVAKQRCGALGGNTKDVCLRDAKAAQVAAAGEAKVDLETGKARARANERVAEARTDADQDKRRAEYNAARERCDAYAGDAKDRCVDDAKSRYGVK